MEVFGKDLILGNFRLSDQGMILASFEYDGNSDDDLGMSVEIQEVFIGDNPIPVFLGDKYTDKLKPQITIVKDPSMYSGNNMYFTEKEYRNIFRLMTGIKNYQWMKIVDDSSEDDIWYRAKIVGVSVKKVGGHVTGIILKMECDSCFGWSKETNINLTFKANIPIKIYSDTDDLRKYIFPTTTITPLSEGDFQITNLTENFLTEIKNIVSNERITMDSKHEILTSTNSHDNVLLNDFNLKWIRLLPEQNEYVTNMDARISFTYRVPRKVVL